MGAYRTAVVWSVVALVWRAGAEAAVGACGGETPCEGTDVEAEVMRTSLLQQRSSQPPEESLAEEPEDGEDEEDEGTEGAKKGSTPSRLGRPGSSEAWVKAAQEFDERQKAFEQKNSGPVWHALKGGHEIPFDEGKVVEKGTFYGKNPKQCQDLCDANEACKAIIMCGATCYLKERAYTDSENTKHNGYCNAYLYSTIEYAPRNPDLLKPSDAPTYTFYTYRSQAPATPDQDYPLENVNTASLGGAVWYLHNEVTKDCRYNNRLGARRFSITRMRRFKVTMKATKPLLNKGMHFSSLCSFDFGECTGPHRNTQWAGKNSGNAHNPEWEEYGYTVGCGVLGAWPHLEFKSALRYPSAVWYSLPGSCPTNDFRKSDGFCVATKPGGLCDSPDGSGNCTFSYEDAGEVDIDEVVGITPKYPDRAAFCRAGCAEATPLEPFTFEEDDGWDPDGKCGPNTFWDNIFDPLRNKERVEKFRAAFRKKYPDSPDLPDPPCDFDRNRYR